MSEIESTIWRTVRLLTVVSMLFVLLLLASSLVALFALNLAAEQPAWARPDQVGAVGLRVQSYAEIGPGGQQQTYAWAVVPDEQGGMNSRAVVDDQQVAAEAASVWPRPPVPTTAVTPTMAAAPPVATTTALRPYFLVELPMVNLRAGPGTTYDIVGVAPAGARYAILARSGEWWQVEVDGVAPWVYGGLGLVEGAAHAVPTVVADTVPTSSPTVQPTSTPSATLTSTSTRLLSYAYSVEARRHPEANSVVLYGLIQDDTAIVGELYLEVEHGGQRWRSRASSYAIQGTTKPSAPTSPDNRPYNVKLDFPRLLFPLLAVTGAWTIRLVDGVGQPLSVDTVITIAPDDSQQEIYLDYRKIKR